MNLLESARILRDTDPSPVNSHSQCHWCEEFVTAEPHKPDCPWLAVPSMVEALEILAQFATQKNWMGAEWHGPIWTYWKARQTLGLEPPDDEDDE